MVFGWCLVIFIHIIIKIITIIIIAILIIIIIINLNQTLNLVNIVSVHCREEGCIGKYIPRGLSEFPRTEIAPGHTLGSQGMYFPIHPSSQQCTDTLKTCTKQKDQI